jgi:LysM repeat protein
MVADAPATQPRGRVGRYLAPAALVGLIAVTVLVVVTIPGGAGGQRRSESPRHAVLRRLPPYWTVRPGDTLEKISAKTGLAVARLEALNRNVDPLALQPGQRLNLWRHPPKPRPKPLGPRFWTVGPGESFGSIAAKTGINIVTLEQRNPQLRPATLQPGDRLKLRP